MTAAQSNASEALFEIPPALSSVPAEDSGSETLGRYRYQAEVAARECLAMLTQERIAYIVCEWHEDFVVVYDDGTMCLVSVKHRELSQNPWTVAALCGDGGLAHLYDRWCACGRADEIRLRLCTNGGLKTGASEASVLSRMCGPDPEVRVGLQEMASKVAKYFLIARWDHAFDNIPLIAKVKSSDVVVEDDFVALVLTFLSRLEISHSLPGRDHIADSNINKLLVPAMVTLQKEGVDHQRSYKEIVDRIELANRGQTERENLAPYIASPSRTQFSSVLRQRIGRRTLTKEIVLDQLVYQNVYAPLIPTGRSPLPAPGGKKLSRKLEYAQVPDDEAMFAERLRSAWYVTWTERRSGLTGDAAALEHLSAEVLDIAFACRTKAKSETPEGRKFGELMNRLCRDQLRVSELLHTPPFAINDLHLRGLLYQLADECLVYFSENFDITTEGNQ